MAEMAVYPGGYEHLCTILTPSTLSTFQKSLLPVHWSAISYPGRTFRLLSNNTYTELLDQETVAKVPFEVTYHDKVGSLSVNVKEAVPDEAILVTFTIKELKEMCVVQYDGLVKNGEGVGAFVPNGVWVTLDLLVGAIKKICSEHYDMVAVKVDSSKSPYNIPVNRPARLDGPEVPIPGAPRSYVSYPETRDPFPRGYGDADLNPVGGFHGGMVVDPRGFRNSGVNPPRFDPIGPGMPRFGRGRGGNFNLPFGVINPDHERPPAGLDDMFM